MSKDVEKRPHYLSPEDRAWVRTRAKEHGVSLAALAKSVGMTRQNMYLLLDEHGAGFTFLWPAIVKALGGTPPSGELPVEDPRLREIIRRWSELSEADRAIIEQVAKRLASSKTRI